MAAQILAQRIDAEGGADLGREKGDKLFLPLESGDPRQIAIVFLRLKGDVFIEPASSDGSGAPP